MSNNPVVGLPTGGPSRGLVRSGSTVSVSSRRRGDDQVRLVGEHYQLGAEIGRGGFGVVYAALDLRNGRSVAIKQVSLHDIDKDELLSIESEISLLRKLNHENIVKYHDTIKTDTWLFIVLEYMENGSLAQFMKKFGSLSETLVAMYITQVLRGLAYLHEQGVLHRDVKGANILTTKDGLVKLADFGVAIKLNETQKSNSVVGSPYWMAPEVIEMAGWSFASDIWSVGCTIIELLTTKPPYFDLAPMAALFRIVQDDHPPLPERISPALHDFIMKCFMKEPRLRSSAEELLNHPWICQIPKNKVEQSTQLVAENVTSSDDRDAMLNTIKLYAKEKKSMVDDPTGAGSTGTGGQQETDTIRRSLHTASARSSTTGQKKSKGDADEKEEEEVEEEEENWDDEFGIEGFTPKPMSLDTKPKGNSSGNGSGSGNGNGNGSGNGIGNQQETKDTRKSQLFQLSKEEANELFEDDDIWEEEKKSTKKTLKKQQQQPPPPSSSSSSSSSSSTSSTIASNGGGGGGLVLLPVEKTAANKLATFSENEDDFVFDEFDQDQLAQIMKSASTTTTATTTTTTTGGGGGGGGGVSSSANSLTNSTLRKRFQQKSSSTLSSTIGKEDEDFDFGEEEEEDDEDKTAGNSSSIISSQDGGKDFAQVLKDRMSKLTSSTTTTTMRTIGGQDKEDADDTSSDGFNEILFDDELDFEYAAGRDTNQKAMAKVVELLALLDPSMDDQVILDACTQLDEIFDTTPSLKRDLTSQAGIVPNIMEALEMKKLDVLYAVLKVINMIIEDNQKFQENLALVGLVPVIVRLTQLQDTLRHHDFVAAEYGGEASMNDPTDLFLEAQFLSKVRFEAAKFVGQSCKTSSLTLQMFIACGGLSVLVDFLTVDSSFSPEKQMELLRIALEGIFNVFNLQTIPKNDICRLFVKAGLLDKFIIVFNDLVAAILYSSPTASMTTKTTTTTTTTTISTTKAKQLSQEGEEITVIMGADKELEEKKEVQAPLVAWKMDELYKMCDIFLLFSQGDAVVKEHMCELSVLEGMLAALTSPSSGQEQEDHVLEEETTAVLGDTAVSFETRKEFGQAMVKILKCIRNLSMEPMTLEKLDRAGAIPTLVRLLNYDPDHSSDSFVQTKEVQNIVLQAMFYLCRINRNRQTHAAQAGLIPFLHRVVLNNSPLKQFALPILCDLAYASPTARAHLWSSKSLSLFVELLDDRYWQIDAMKAISIWLIHDTVKIENALLETNHLMQLIECFRSAQETEFENLLEPLCEMLTRSVRLNQALGRASLFVLEILKRLQFPKAIVRKNLLKMLKSLFESHTCPSQFVVEFELYPVLKALKQDDYNMILVKEIASQLLQAVLVATGVV